MAYYITKECIYCGREFTTVNPNSFCCKSLDCLKQHSRLITSELNPDNYKFKLVCQVCGEEFYTNNKKSKCCNSQCSGSLGILGAIKKYGEPQYFEDAICVNCGKPFSVQKGSAKYRRYCSPECVAEYRLQQVKDELIGNTYERLYITDVYRKIEKSGKQRFYASYICNCGTVGETTVDGVRLGQSLSCGCYAKENNQANSGENSPVWKGGISPIKDYLRSKISEWKIESMKASEYKCIITGKPFDDIHHLYSFAKIVDKTFDITKIERKPELKDYTQEELEELRDVCLELHYEHPLGVCLCHEIHALFHSIYGRHEFTPKDFYEFKQRYSNGEFNTED